MMQSGQSGFCKVHFGDVPAATALEVAKNMVIKYGHEIDPVTAEQMNQSYVNDGMGGGTDQRIDVMVGDCNEVNGELYYTGTVSQILARGSLRIKCMVRSGETNETTIRKLGGMMLGHHWDAVIDQISFKLEVDLATKKENKRYLEDSLGEYCNPGYHHLDQEDNPVGYLKLV